MFTTHQFLKSSLLVGHVKHSSRRFYIGNTIKENETIILKSIVNDRAEPILAGPLKPGSSVSYKKLKKIIKHEDIIGHRVEGLVRAKNQILYKVDRPTLAEYTDKSSRLVTPIYSQDANVIISLLDLHPTVPGVEAEKLEIFEAGTGTGALTLYLARAIHAANSVAPEIPPDILSIDPNEDSVKEKYDEWRAQRRAIIHTLDINGERSRHAAANIKNYRGGMYFPHIDFHTGSIEALLSEKLAAKSNIPFLDHAILDLPSPEKYMKIVSQAVKERGYLLLFVPSITQINKAALFVRKMALPWSFENVLELGGSLATGGREWDVRFVRPRAFLKALAAEELKTNEYSSEVDDTIKETESTESYKAENEGAESTENLDTPKEETESTLILDSEKQHVESDVNPGPEAEGTESAANLGTRNLTEESANRNVSGDDGGWEMVCRPKVGVRVTNGGFVGIWRKLALNKPN